LIGVTCAEPGPGTAYREGWKALLSSQGFDRVVAAGEGTASPRLLSRQTVVAGLSDGAVRVYQKEDALVRMQLSDAAPPLPPDFLHTIASMPVR